MVVVSTSRNAVVIPAAVACFHDIEARLVTLTVLTPVILSMLTIDALRCYSLMLIRIPVSNVSLIATLIILFALKLVTIAL